YLMMAQEIVTSIQEHAKLTIVLVDNHGFSSIGSLSRSVGSDGFGTQYRYRKDGSLGTDSELDAGDLLPVDLAANAESLGAHVMTEPGRIEVETFARPDPEPGAVLMEVVYSGVCGTDKHTFRGETIQYAGTPHERRLEYPLICGHENVGVVVETGGEVLASDGSPLRAGDRIVPGANVACGRCWFCREGFPYYACERLEDYGNSLNAARPPHLLRGWAELMYLLPGTPLFRVPDELPSEVAVLTEVMAVT